MNSKVNHQTLEAAKKAFTSQYGDRRWYSGVGIAKTREGRFVLRVNILPDGKAREEIPVTFMGLDVETKGGIRYVPRGLKKRVNKKSRTVSNLRTKLSDIETDSESYLRKLSKLLDEEIRGWKTDNREWSRLSFRRLRSEIFDAGVIRSKGPKAHYTIEISDGFALELRKNFRSIVNQEDIFSVHWQRRSTKTGEPKVTSDDLRGWVTNSNYWTDQFTTIGVRFVLNHEVAHVLRGHLYYDRHNPAWSGKSGYSEVSAGFVDRKTAGLWRTFEIDADRVGADLFGQTTVLGTWANEKRSIRRQYCSLLMFAVGITLLSIEVANRGKKVGGSNVYQPPFVRFLIVIDVLGAALSRELNLGEKSLMQASLVAVGLLRSATRHLGYGNRTWGVGDQKSWILALAAREKALAYHLKSLEEMLQARSTLFPKN